MTAVPDRMMSGPPASAGQDNRIFFAVLLELLLIIANIGTAVVMAAFMDGSPVVWIFDTRAWLGPRRRRLERGGVLDAAAAA
jgi:hypothetical protein